MRNSFYNSISYLALDGEGWDSTDIKSLLSHKLVPVIPGEDPESSETL